MLSSDEEIEFRPEVESKKLQLRYIEKEPGKGKERGDKSERKC